MGQCGAYFISASHLYWVTSTEIFMLILWKMIFNSSKMTISHFGRSSYSLTSHHLRAFNLIYLPSLVRLTRATMLFFHPTQTAQTMLRPTAICCAYGHLQVPPYIYSSVGTWARQRGLSGVRIIFCHIVWDMTRHEH